MFESVIFLIVSLVLVVIGADKLVDGASAIARKAGVSEFVIGLTIVGFGTSCPELVVSLTGAIEGLPSVSLGNVLGSNIFNSMLILGLTALLMPIPITTENRRRDIPINLAITLMLVGLIACGTISRITGAVFLALFALYMYFSFKNDSKTEEETEIKDMKTGVAVLYVVAGLLCLVFGGKYFVDNGVEIARHFGVSEKFIAITLLAGGTSLPELVTCVIAAAKKRGQLALGNIIGSNIFNILLILGCSAVVRPIDCTGMNLADMVVLVLSSVLILNAAFIGKKNEIDRLDGAIMLICEAAYLAWLFINL